MTKQEWLGQARRDSNKIRSLISSFHPASGQARRTVVAPITAPNAEVACENVRRAIRSDEAGMQEPAERFDKALADGDISALMSLMNSAWFGVPESTSCWRLEGFSEAVELLEDPPDEEEY